MIKTVRLHVTKWRTLVEQLISGDGLRVYVCRQPQAESRRLSPLSLVLLYGGALRLYCLLKTEPGCVIRICVVTNPCTA